MKLRLRKMFMVEEKRLRGYRMVSIKNGSGEHDV